MSTQGPLIAGTGADDAAIGVAMWTNPGNITAADGVYATNGGGTGSISDYLKATNFGFTLPTSGYQVLGIFVEVLVKSTSAIAIDWSVRLYKGGVLTGSDKAASAVIGTTASWIGYGALNDLWGASWLTTDINASTFGAAYSFKVPGISDTVSVDAVRITVTYSAGDLNVVNYFALTQDGGGPGVAWTTPANAENAPDSAYATVAVTNPGTGASHLLNFSHWQGSTIPDDMQLVGVKLALFGHGDAAAIYTVGLNGPTGGIGNTKLATGSLAGSDGWSADFGSETDLWGLPSIAASTANDPAFGMRLQISVASGSASVSIDSGRMTIYYSAGLVGPPTEVNIDCSVSVANRYAALAVNQIPMERIDPAVLLLKEAPHPDAFGPMFVQRAPTPCERAFLEPMERVDPKLLTLPNEVEPLRIEQFMTMGVQRAPEPRRRPEQVILMGEYDPTSFTLPNAPEPLHPENMQPMPCLPIGPQTARPWLAPISSEQSFVGLLSSGSAHVETMHSISPDAGRRNWRTSYQPDMSVNDPGAPTTRDTPAADLMPMMAQPVRQRPRAPVPSMEATTFAWATPGDPSLYPIGMTMTANPPAARRQVQSAALEQSIVDSWSAGQFPEPAMYAPLARPARSAAPSIEAASLAPQQFANTQIIDWNTPLSQPVQQRPKAQNIGLQAEVGGETVDMALNMPDVWTANEQAQLNRRREVAPPSMETPLGLNLPAAVDVTEFGSMAVPANRPTRRPAASSELPVFTDVAAANSDYLRSMDVPLPQLRRQAASLTAEGIEFEGFFVAAPFTLTSMDTPLSLPMFPQRHVEQLPLEAESLDRSTQAPSIVLGMDVQRPMQPRRPQPSPVFSPVVDVLAAGDFMNMAVPQVRPPRAVANQVFVGGLLDPGTLQKSIEVPEPMYVQPRRVQPPQQQGTALLVGQDLFGNLPPPSSYEAHWIVPARLPRVQPVPIETISTTVYLVGGNPAPFTGSGAVVVAAAWIGPAVGVAAGCIIRGAKGS